MYTMISGSQKSVVGNSMRFLNYVSEYLDEYQIFDLRKKNFKEIINNIKISNAIVLAFPLYVDAPNSLTLSFLDYIYDNKIDLESKRIYVIINCGFKEGEQNITALNIIKRWCNKVNATYSGCILIGAGEVVGNPKLKFISKTAFKRLKQFSISAGNGIQSDDIITTIDLLSNKTYCMLANYSWYKKSRGNKLKKSDIVST